MLSDKDYLEATRRFKNKKENAHARQRYHALLLVTKGYSYLETADILFVDEGTISRWASLYQARGLDGLKNHPQWGGEHGQRPLTMEELTLLSTLLGTEAMPGTEVGSGWTVKAIRFAYYNFCRIHSTIRCTPAMEAGLTGHIWELKELLV